MERSEISVGDTVWCHSFGKWRIGTVTKVSKTWAAVSYTANVTTGRVNVKPFPIRELHKTNPMEG